MRFRRPKKTLSYFAWPPPAEIGDQPMRKLAAYNDEVAHGIVHTPEWDALMAEAQKAFNAQAHFFHTDEPIIATDP